MTQQEVSFPLHMLCWLPRNVSLMRGLSLYKYSAGVYLMLF